MQWSFRKFLVAVPRDNNILLFSSYVKNHKNGVKFVERGYGPCTFKECEPCKVIADLKPLKSFYPSMRAKHDVLREIDELNNKNPGSRKKKNKSGKPLLRKL